MKRKLICMLFNIKKHKTLYITFIYFLLGITAFSQNKRIDSLLSVLKTDKEDSVKTKHLNKITEEYLDIGEYAKALLYGEQSLALSQRLGDKKSVAEAYNNIGEGYWRKGDYPEALKNHFIALKIREEIKYKKGIASSYNYIGIIYAKQGNDKEALKYTQASLKLQLELNNKNAAASAYNNIGNIYDNQHNYPEALKNYSAALKIFEESKYKYAVAAMYGNIGLIYDEQGNYKEALKNYDLAIKIKETLGEDDDLVSPLINLGELYITLKKPKEAKYTLDKALQLSMKLDDKNYIKDTYACMALLDSANGNYRAAFQHNKLYYKYNDSIYNETNASQINELSARYESEKKEKEIALLNVELLTKKKAGELLNAQVKEKNGIILAVIFGAILLVISILLFFSRRQLKQKNQHQTEINKQQEHTAIAIIQTQENERNLIAQDLHDSIGTYLSTLKINLENFKPSIPSDKTEQYQNTSRLVDQTSDELRSIMKNLSSETLQQNGLESALKELVESINRLGITRFDFISNGLPKGLDNIVEINLYRVAQELLNNCIKHAHAAKATLQLIDHENTLLLMIEDNGEGFDVKNIKQINNHGMGLKNIRNRINFIKGTIKIESHINKGSTFIIEIPKQLVKNNLYETSN
ncbi:MAG: tetratricopeptide repeat-containing sensor histidine kinase [Bacteroidia bacterium]